MRLGHLLNDIAQESQRISAFLLLLKLLAPVLVFLIAQDRVYGILDSLDSWCASLQVNTHS